MNNHFLTYYSDIPRKFIFKNIDIRCKTGIQRKLLMGTV